MKKLPWPPGRSRKLSPPDNVRREGDVAAADRNGLAGAQSCGVADCWPMNAEVVRRVYANEAEHVEITARPDWCRPQMPCPSRAGRLPRDALYLLGLPPDRFRDTQQCTAHITSSMIEFSFRGILI